jgi:penicillin amidase/acyl-homoserine-lactone acylase
MVGGLMPGAPIVLHGHNPQLGWAHTINTPDLLDVYELEINPQNAKQYRFDGEWRELEVREAPIEVKLLGPIKWTFKREVLWSIHGPVMRGPAGTFALRLAGFGEVRHIEQWYRMNKARTFEEWMNAMRMNALPMFNTGYADAAGNIFYLYNGRLPLRAPGYDWKNEVPGNTSATLWNDYLPFERLPRVLNPASGFVQNCNNTPFQTTSGSENPRPENFAPSLGIDTHMTNRGLRALELFGSDSSITAQEFYEYKYDVAYSPRSKMAQLIQQVLAEAPPRDSLMLAAREILRAWDLRTNPENTRAALPVLAFRTFVDDYHETIPSATLIDSLQHAAAVLVQNHGSLAVEWQKVNRLRRGELDLGLGGGPDILHAVYGDPDGKGRLLGHTGDSYVLLVNWSAAGKVSSQSIHVFGSATANKTSKHYADQAPLFVERKLKPVWMNEEEIRGHLEREYRPGEEDQR